MPIEITRDASRRRITVRASGTVTIDELLRLIKTERATLDRQMWPMLFDARGANTDATEEDIRAAVRAVADAAVRQGTRGHVAIVADVDAFYARMLQYETDCVAIGVRVIRVFRQLADAEQWLSIMSAGHLLR